MQDIDLLRLHKEPCNFYNEMQIHLSLMNNVHPFMNMLERFYFAWNNNHEIVVQPTKQVFVTDGVKGDFRVMPCVINKFDNKIIKAVKIIGTNEEEKQIKDKIAVGKSLLIDPTDNFVKGIFDVCSLSSFRTAAISALAYKYTVGTTSQKIGLIGTGRIGSYIAVILSSWLQIGELYIHDINQTREDDFIETFGRKMKITKLSLDEICETCTSVFLSTTSKEPLLNAGNAKNFQFISSVGADADNLSELHESLVKDFRIISESKQNIYFGDLGRWHDKKLIKPNQIIELRDVMGGKKKPKTPYLFISTGTALQDALICQFLYDKLNSRTLKILFYPEYPRKKPYRYTMIQMCKILGYNMTNNPDDHFDLVIRWEDRTYAKINNRINDLGKNNNIINLKCIDISKRHIEKIFTEVFGYKSFIDPCTFKGECVKKSNLNGQHDGEIIQCPVENIENDFVYQKLIDNRHDDEFVVDMRVPIFKKTIPFTYLKYKPENDRFSLSVKGTMEEVKNVFSHKEIEKILLFCEKFGLDCGELDIVRNNSDNRIYILDANNTPTTHFAGFPEHQKCDSLYRMSMAFAEAFSAN